MDSTMEAQRTKNQTKWRHAVISCQKVRSMYKRCLHDAIKGNDSTYLTHLLSRPNLTLNCINSLDETPLVSSLRKNTSDTFIMQLINAGCDVNMQDNYTTPLHKAVERQSPVVAHALIKQGAEINAVVTECEITPLHFAVTSGNEEAVSMLLYYGADVNIRCHSKVTPIMFAFQQNRTSIAEMLFNYYDDLSGTDITKRNVLHYAVQYKSPLVAKLIEAGTSVNCVSVDGTYPLMYALFYNTAEVYKLIWSKLNLETLLKGNIPFLFLYLNKCRFSNAEWLECLTLLLSCPIALQLMEQCTNWPNPPSFLSTLLDSLYNRKIDLQNRLTIINICTTLGTIASTRDIQLAWKLYKFGDELETLIYAHNFYKEDLPREVPCYLTAHILGMEKSSPEYCNKIREYFNKCVVYPGNERMPTANEKIHPVSFTSNVATLVELSRGPARRFIRQGNRIEQPYQFHDVINNLCLPQYLKDVLRYKKLLKTIHK